jgi:hypothetical protein
MQSALFDPASHVPVACVGVELDGDPRDFFFLPAAADRDCRRCYGSQPDNIN